MNNQPLIDAQKKMLDQLFSSVGYVASEPNVIVSSEDLSEIEQQVNGADQDALRKLGCEAREIRATLTSLLERCVDLEEEIAERLS